MIQLFKSQRRNILTLAAQNTRRFRLQVDDDRPTTFCRFITFRSSAIPVLRLPQSQITNSSLSETATAITARRQLLHASTRCFAPVSSSGRSTLCSSTAADNLLSLWSRRPPAAPTSEASNCSATATIPNVAQANDREDSSMESLKVEELLLFGEDDNFSPKPTSLKAAGLRRDGNANENNTVLSVRSASTNPASSCSSPNPTLDSNATASSAASASGSGEINEYDADVYGMAASTTSLEGHIMEDLLQQASLNSADNRLDDEESGGGLEVEDGDDAVGLDLTLQNKYVPNTPVSESLTSKSAVAISQVKEHISELSSSAGTSIGEEAHQSTTIDTSEYNNEANLVFSNASSPALAAETEFENAVQLEEVKAEKESNGEDDSFDTVLEEETDRMLQVALANMMRESATNTAAALPNASNDANSKNAGTGDYVFFTKEAVMAAKSLEASEKASSDRMSSNETNTAAERVDTKRATKADFDDDAAREAELESLGLDMET